MLRRVLARAPLPVSAAVTAVSELPAAVAKKLRSHGVKVRFTSPNQLKSIATSSELLPLGFTGATGETGVLEEVAAPAKQRTVLAGLGEAPTVRDYRLALTNAVRRAKKAKVPGITIVPPEGDVLTMPDLYHPSRPLARHEVIEKTACFATTAAYEYNRLKSAADTAGAPKQQKQQPHRRRALQRPTPPAAAPPLHLTIASNQLQAVQTGAVVGTCVNDARNLGNLREDEGIPAFYAEWVRRAVLPEGVKLRKVLRGEQLRAAGLELAYNVGKGSVHEPYVVVLEYTGNRRAAHAAALVGKGVTFDCGGLNVKPYGSMETMHHDMMGAATALATIKAVAMLKLPVNVVAAVGLVENAIGPHSYFPSSILTSLKGPTVEVLNTDAEGRLVLADLLTYVQRGDVRLEKPAGTIIDLATLTGAVIVSLGSRRAGLFSNSARLTESLMATGTRSGEELWPMPIGEEHKEAVKGGIADLRNAVPGRAGGACTAAAFLSNFIEKGHDWAHLDIAGAADGGGDQPKGFHPAGVSGFGVQLLVDFLRK